MKTGKELIESIVYEMVDSPEQVKVTSTDAIASTVIEVQVGPLDIGKVIGKAGRNAMALRTILNCVGMKQGRRFTLIILDHSQG